MLQINHHEWAPSKSRKINVQIVTDRIDELAARGGGVCKPRQLWQSAVDETDPLHPLFEWNDEKAADSYRDHQARQIIRTVRPVFDEEGPADPAPAYVSVGQGKGRGYMRLESAVSDADLKAQLIEACRAQLKSLRLRYRAIDTFAKVWAEVDRV